MRTILACALLLGVSTPAQYIPSGVHLKQSGRKVDDIEWEKTKRTREVEPLQSFISRFPKSRHVRSAERLLAKLQASERSRSKEDGKAYTLVPESKDVVRAVPADQHRK